MAIVTPFDFNGKYVVARSGSQSDQITEAVSDNEMKFLAMVLGVELRDTLLNDLGGGGIPVTPKYLYIYNAFQVQSFCDNKLLSSNGMKRMLLGFIYFTIVNDKRTSPSFMGGNTRPVTENSEQVIDLKMFDYYNESVNSSRAIQEYIRQNIEDYPEYKGQEIRYNSPF